MRSTMQDAQLTIGSRRSESQTAWLNYAIIGAFRLAPALWDVAVGPLFNAVSRRREER